MKKYNIGLLLAACMIAANVNFANADTADYTGGLTELKGALGGTATTRNFFQTGLIELDGNLPGISTAGTNLTINGNDFGMDGKSKVGFSVVGGQKLNINNVGSLSDTGAILTSIKDFTRATGGGAVIYNNGGEVIISDSVFTNNKAENTSNGTGGIIHNYNFNIKNTITNSTFDNNRARWGGVIANFNTTGTVNIDGSTFSNNYANQYGGVIYNYSNHSNVTTNIANSKFIGNSAYYGGGAIYNRNQSGVTTLTISNSEFIGNHGDNWYGGAIYNVSGSMQISNNSVFDGNYATDGGAIYHRAGTLTVSDTVFKNNYSTTQDAGAVDVSAGTTSTFTNSSFTNNYAAARGGAIFITGSADPANTVVTLENVTFTGNHADGGLGGAIYNNVGTLNIKANNGISSFTGNYDTTGSNAIYLKDAILNLNAGNGGTITFDDAITSNINTNNININSAAIDAGLTDGTVNFNSSITSATVNIFDGTTNFGKSSIPNINYGDVAFNITGGVQNFTNNTFLNNSRITINDLSPTAGEATNIVGSTFNGGAFTGSGGAINVTSGALNLNSDTFSNYTASVSGGAIYNGGTVNLTGGTFSGNIASGSGAGIGGGAIYNNTGATFNIANTTFTSNRTTGATSSGAAIYNLGIMSIIGGAFNSNIAASSGGAITNHQNGTLYLTNTNFTGNQASTVQSGGAIYNYKGSVNIFGGTYSNNTAGYGGAITSSMGSLVINGSTFANNSAVTCGGAIYSTNLATIDNSIFSDNSSLWGGAVYNNSATIDSVVTLNNDIFINNTGKYGGALSNIKTAHVIGGAFTSNDATTYGGAIYNYGTGALDVSNATFNLNTAADTGGAIQNFGNTTVTGGSFTGNTAVNKGGAIYNDLKTLNVDRAIFNTNSSKTGGAINNSGTATIIGGSFSGNISDGSGAGIGGGAIYNNTGATSNVSNATFSSNKTTGVISSGGAIYNLGTVNITGGKFNSNTSATNGGALYNGASSTMNITNSTFSSNSAVSGGAIYNDGGTLNIQANGGNTFFTGNTDQNGSNAIYLQGGTLNLNAGNGGQIIFNDKIASSAISNPININKTGSSTLGDPPVGSATNGNVRFNEAVSNSTVNLYNGTMSLGKENYLNGNNLNLYGGSINLENGLTGTANFNNLAISGTTNFGIDADLINGVADKITSVNPATGSGILNVNHINFLNDSNVNLTNIAIADASTKDFVQLSQTSAESVLYKYNMSYSASSGSINVINQGFSPSVLAAPVAATSGAYLTQTSTCTEALGRMDALMSLPYNERLLMKYKNKTASADGQFVFSPTMLPEANRGVWFKQYTTFENIPLNNGPNVSSVGYGMLVGEDSSMKDLGNGYSGYLTAYAGYNGSHQNYDSVGSYQNGGLLGLTGTVYKGNFFAALTASAGASAGNNYNKFGVDNFTTLMGGAAIKTGYNFETFRGKVIFQPSLMAGYTFLNTFDYQAASGANITSDHLNAFQISPGLKIIGNLKNGWQPYLGVNMVWNIMDSSRFYANDVQLPQLSVAPYVEYGFGLQRKWGDRFTGFGQAMARGGGRNGVALQIGFRWAI